MSYFPDAIQELRTVSISDYEDRVEYICRDLDDVTMEQGGWPAPFFQEVLNLLSDARFLSVRTSWHLVKFIKENWKYLSPADVSSLKNILAKAFDKFGDFMGAFLAAEILGRFYPDQNTLATLITLNRICKPPARELVPLGLEKLARTTDDQALRQSAVRELNALLEDDLEAVRYEAALSLDRIERTK